MMFEEVAKMLYVNIMDIEVALLMKYKINPFEIMSQLTTLDLQNYMEKLHKRTEEEEKARKSAGGGSNFAKALIAMRDILNFITYKD